MEMGSVRLMEENGEMGRVEGIQLGRKSGKNRSREELEGRETVARRVGEGKMSKSRWKTGDWI